MPLKAEKIYLDTKKSVIAIAILSFIEVIFQLFMQISDSLPTYFVYAISPQILLLNFLPIFLIMLTLYFITNRVSVSYIVFSLVFDILLIVNHYKIYFRDEPLKPADIILGKEAANILTNYQISFSLKIFVLTLLLVILAVYLVKYIKNKKSNIFIRISGIIVSLAVMVLSYQFIYKSEEIYKKISWVPNEYHETSVVNCRGFLYSFINSFSKMDYQEPENYSREYAKEILAEYDLENEEEETEIVPNVIAIMSESFFDPQSADNLKFHTGKNPLANYNKLKKESYYGNITVPGFAGATALTEFEFLTGINISLIDKSMPSPYNRYINKKMNALPWFFKEKGFETVAIHPGYQWFYNRRSVYKYLGFDRSIFLEDLDYTPEKTNYYTNDSETAKLIIEDYKKHLEENYDKGYFNLTVTIQNHGPYMDYETERVERVIKNSAMTDELHNIINNYMDGLSDADNMLMEIKNFIETVDKPTVLIFFGDHLPYFDAEQEGYNAIGYDISSPDLTTLNRKYSTPYIICSNKAFKNIKSEQGEKILKGKGNNISSSFLMTELFDYMNIDAPAYTDYLSDLKKKVNIISPYYYMEDGKLVTEISDELKNDIEELKILQYYNMKDYEK